MTIVSDMILGVRQKALKRAYEKGYRVVDGEPVGPNGNVLSTCVSSWGYHKFSVRDEDRSRVNVPVHRLVAYDKYGDSIFEKGIHVRHLDGNKTNNHPDNIAIGTASQNQMDKPQAQRLGVAKIAASYRRKLTDEQAKQLRKDREEGATYPQLMSKYGIAKSTVSYIVNKKTY